MCLRLSQRVYYSSLGVDCKNLLREIAIIKDMRYHVKKLPLNHSYYPHRKPGPWIVFLEAEVENTHQLSTGCVPNKTSAILRFLGA